MEGRRCVTAGVNGWRLSISSNTVSDELQVRKGGRGRERKDKEGYR